MPRETVIKSDNCLYKEMLHEHLQETLGLPDYYGRNLSALADCLAEAGEPLHITFDIDGDSLPAGMQAYVLRLAQVCAREAIANENVSLTIL